MAFPSNTRFARSRRKLGRGQYPAIPQVIAAVAAGTSLTAVITYSSPVTVRGNPSLDVADRSITGVVVNSPTQVTLTLSGSNTGKAWSQASPDPNVTGNAGGQVAAAAGTF